ncbi:MAG: ribose-phosphate diphosphokinase, partial [Candidatus Hydrothermarchaeales archaeon]
MIIFGGSSCQVLGKEISDGLGADFGRLAVKKFPDGELFLKVDTEVKGEDVVVVQSISRPHHENLMELLLLLDTLRDLGSGKIITVVPYYGYGRQDRRFDQGEALSSKTVAKHIQVNSDEFLTVNLHKKHILEFFDIPSMELDA